MNTYYAGTGSGACVNAVFAGMLCTTGPAAQPTGGTTLPTETDTYNVWGSPTTMNEVSGSSTRTTANSYDSADRPTGTAITGGQGTTTPATTIGYDPATGLQTTTSDSTGATLTTGYDTLGQATSYTDADGNTSRTGYDLDGRSTTKTDGRGTSTSGYDGNDSAGQTEHRGLVTTMNDSGAGSFTASYDADGKIASEVYPSGLAATWTYDNDENPVSLTYAKGGTTWLSYIDTYSAQNQIVGAKTPLSAQAYTYDPDSRLAKTQDTTSIGGTSTCTTRAYGYDANSNRASLVVRPASSGTTCSDTTTPTSSASHTYNTGDQSTDTGYTYDAFGRTLTVPAADVTGGAAMSLGYFTNDMVRSENQGASTDTFGLDPLQDRIRTESSSATGRTTMNHYNDSTDSPAWTDNGDGTWTRDVTGIDGNLAANQPSTGAVTLQLTDLKGNVGATAPDDSGATGPSAVYAYTEFEAPEPGVTPPTTYGALGGKQRSTADLGGLSLMGQRLYNATTGRFLQTDPVPGGSANCYDYADQDPVDGSDLSGQWHHHWRRWLHRANRIAGAVATVACFAGPAACLGAGLAAAGLSTADRFSQNRGRHWRRNLLYSGVDFAAARFIPEAGRYERPLYKFRNNRQAFRVSGGYLLHRRRAVYQGFNYARSWFM